jgi:hypothetical protein
MKQIALNIAETVLADKKDQRGLPYIEYVKRVSENAKNYYVGRDYHEHSEEIEIIGLLYKVLEVSPIWKIEHIDSIFRNNLITSSLLLLTEEFIVKNNEISYEEYIKKVQSNGLVRAVKMAELEDNLDLKWLPNVTEEDFKIIKRYHKAFTFISGDKRVATWKNQIFDERKYVTTEELNKYATTEQISTQK